MAGGLGRLGSHHGVPEYPLLLLLLPSLQGQAFEAGKARLKGLHFVGVQSSPEADEVQGFWLCREMTNL